MDPFDWDEFEDEDEFSDLFMRDIEKKRIMPPLYGGGASALTQMLELRRK